MSEQEQVPRTPEEVARDYLQSIETGGRTYIRGYDHPQGEFRLRYETDPKRIIEIARKEMNALECAGDPFYPSRRAPITSYDVRTLRSLLSDLKEGAETDTLSQLTEVVGNKATGEVGLEARKAVLTEAERQKIAETAETMLKETDLRWTLHNAWSDWLTVSPDWEMHCSHIKNRYKTIIDGNELGEIGRLPEVGKQIDKAMRGFVCIGIAKGFPTLLEGLAHEFGSLTVSEVKEMDDQELTRMFTPEVAREAGFGDRVLKKEIAKAGFEQVDKLIFERVVSRRNRLLTDEQRQLIREARGLKLDNIFADRPSKSSRKKVYDWLGEKTEGATEATIEQAIKIFCVTDLASTFGIHNDHGLPEQLTTPLTPDITGHLQYFQVKYATEGEFIKDPDVESRGQAPIGNPGLFMCFPGLITDMFRENAIRTNDALKQKSLWELWWNQEIDLGSLPFGDIDLDIDNETVRALKHEGVDVAGIARDNIHIYHLVRLLFAGKIKTAQLKAPLWTEREGFLTVDSFRDLNKAFNISFPMPRDPDRSNRERMWMAKYALLVSKLSQRIPIGILRRPADGEYVRMAQIGDADIFRVLGDAVKTGYIKNDNDVKLVRGMLSSGLILQWHPEYLERGSFEPQDLDRVDFQMIRSGRSR